MITVPILVKGYQYKVDQVWGMVQEDEGRLIVNFARGVTMDQIGYIFGRISYKVLLSENLDGIEHIRKIHIVSWSF